VAIFIEPGMTGGDGNGKIGLGWEHGGSSQFREGRVPGFDDITMELRPNKRFGHPGAGYARDHGYHEKYWVN